MRAMRRLPVRPRTIQGSLFALIGLALVPLVLFGAYELVREYREQRDVEVGASAELARSLAMTAEAFVLDLVHAEYAAAASFALYEHPPAEIQRDLAMMSRELPGVRDMSWLDASANVVASSEPQLVGKSLYARDYFHEISAGAEWRVSQVVRSLVDGRPMFIVARGLRRRSGELAGVVTAAVDAAAFGRILGERSGAGATSICDSAGTLVAISPPMALDWSARRRMGEHRWVQRALAGQEALGVFRSPLTGERRIGAIVPIYLLGWAAHASRPFNEAIAPVRRAAILQTAVLLAATVAALVTALLVARRISGPLSALEGEAQRLARGGEPILRVGGPTEVRRVARALQLMASGLAARCAELEAVNRRLAGSEERFRLLAENAQDLVYRYRLLPEPAFEYVSPAATRIVGYTPEEHYANPALGMEYVHPDDRERLARVFAGADDASAPLVLRCIRKDGTPIWLEQRSTLVRDAEGRVVAVEGIARDVTHVRDLQEERETLMQTVSHDLRTPLHVLVGHAQILRRHGDAEVRRRTEAILASAGRMTRLIGDLVDAARLEAGHVALHLEPMDLSAFLAGWRDRMAGALALERVRLDVRDAVPAVLADPARLDQILVNLVSNALKYSVADSEVRVTLEPTPSALRLSVADRGPGIAPDELSRLFERYYRTKSAAQAEGLGLGLFITRKLVDAHGWRIEVESELGKGSVFTVVVPTTGARASRSSAAA